MRTRSSEFIKFWLPVLIWLCVIFVGSTDLMSAEHTSRIIGPILRWFKRGISDESIAHVQFVVRKTAHVSEYAILSLLMLRALYHAMRQGRLAHAALATLVFSAVFAASDEFHQSFVPSRTASVRDVMIDTVGALAGVAIYWMFVPKKQRPP